MGKESYGIIAAVQRARVWSSQLETPGQRLVLSALVMHMGADSVSDPSIGTAENPGQLMIFTGFTARAIRRILTELQDLGVIAPLSDRSPGGRNRTTKWTITPPETRTGESVLAESKPGLGSPKPGPGKPETRTGESDTESSEISEDEIPSLTESRLQRLRAEGYTYSEIMKEIGSSIGEMSA